MRNRFPTSRPRATIADVAAAAGVSKATVSKFLGGKEYYVAAETRERIAEAVRELDFQPNAIAQGLSRQRSDTIGVVVASVANPFYPELIAGVEDVIGTTGYTLLLGSSDGEAGREARIVRSMMQRQVDGVIMASVTMRDGEVARLAESGLSVVLASRNLSRSLVDTVMVDNVTGARMATAHLLGHGHRRIGHISGPQDVVPFRSRLTGFTEELRAHGTAIEPDLVVPSLTTAEAGAGAAERLLDLPEPPTAVFVANDSMALGVLDACARRGVRIPEDLAVVGFDGIWVGGLPGVRLTTVDSRARQVGREAASLLVGRIDTRRAAGAATSPETRVLRPELVVRRSCGCDGPEGGR
jgi:LacI family transcriptional regulator